MHFQGSCGNVKTLFYCYPCLCHIWGILVQDIVNIENIDKLCWGLIGKSTASTYKLFDWPSKTKLCSIITFLFHPDTKHRIIPPISTQNLGMCALPPIWEQVFYSCWLWIECGLHHLKFEFLQCPHPSTKCMVWIYGAHTIQATFAVFKNMIS